MILYFTEIIKIRLHFLGLSFYSPKTTLQIGVFNHTTDDSSNYKRYKIIQFGIYNWARGDKGMQIGILNSTSGVEGLYFKRRIRLLFNRKLFCQGRREGRIDIW